MNNEPITDIYSFTYFAGLLRLDGTTRQEEEDFNLAEVLIEPSDLQVRIEQFPNMHVWTLIEYDGTEILESGISFVNRLGYMMTTIDPKDPRLDSFREDGVVAITFFQYDKEGDNEASEYSWIP